MIKPLCLACMMALVCTTAMSQEEDDVVEGVEVVEVQVEGEAVAVAEAVVEVVEVQADGDAVEEEIEFAVVGQRPEDRMLAKLQVYAKVEAAFVRRVCELSEAQEKLLSGIDSKWVKQAAKRPAAKNAMRVQQPGLIAQFFGARPQAVQIRGANQVNPDVVKHKISDKINEVLTPEQQKEYLQGKEARDKFRAEALAEALIESLQDRLGLTDQQRATTVEKMIPWVQKTNVRVDMYFNGNNYFPDIPRTYLSALTKEQLTVYNGMQRHLFTDSNFNDGQNPIVIKK